MAVALRAVLNDDALWSRLSAGAGRMVEPFDAVRVARQYVELASASRSRHPQRRSWRLRDPWNRSVASAVFSSASASLVIIGSRRESPRWVRSGKPSSRSRKVEPDSQPISCDGFPRQEPHSANRLRRCRHRPGGWAQDPFWRDRRSRSSQRAANLSPIAADPGWLPNRAWTTGTRFW